MNPPSLADSPGMEPVIADNPAVHRFEARVGGELVGFLAYHLTPSAMVLTHTEVDSNCPGGERKVSPADALSGRPRRAQAEHERAAEEQGKDRRPIPGRSG